MRTAYAAVVLAPLLAVTGCTSTVSGTAITESLSNPVVSDDMAEAQLSALAHELVTLGHLDGVDAGFAFGSCNDDGGAPYQGTLEVGFIVPPGADPVTYVHTVAAAAVAHGGWSAGPPPGQTYYGTAINKDGVAASLNPPHIDGDGKATIELWGQCRNWTDRPDGTKGDPHPVWVQ
jgi:hypothetical protein